MINFKNKKILITGASGGIGGAIAKKLHEQGAKVILSGTNLVALESLADELGEGARFFDCDLSDPVEIEGLINKCYEGLEGLDILVNNAGLSRDNLMLRMSDNDWDTVLDVNLRAAFRLSRASLRRMAKQRYGRIINITSIVGIMGNPGQVNYAASKAGMIGMAKSLAKEVASRGITVNCIAPGFVISPMTDALTEKQTDSMLAVIPAGRFGSPQDIAHAVVYLASDEAAYVTGQTVHVNGGMAMV